MMKLVTVVSHVRVSHLLCCSAAVLLAACGGGSADLAEGPQNQTAAQSFDSAASPLGASIAGADDSSAATTIESGTEPTGAAIEPAFDSPAPSTLASSEETDSDTGPDGSTRLLATSTVVPAAAIGNLYVTPTGSDSNPGTQAKPVKTIARADVLARAGYVIHVAPGTYKVAAPSLGSAGIRTTKSGTATARIKFVSDVKGAAKIVFTGTGMAWNSKGSYVDIEGFDISGAGRIGILIEGAKSTVTKNFVHDLTVTGGCNGSGGSAINSWGPGGNIIDSNVVKNVGYQWVASRSCNTVQGIYLANANNKVSNNVISGIASVGINTWHGATASTLVNNTIFNSKIGIWVGQGDSGGTATGSANNYVANNIIYSTGWGITESGKVGSNNRYVNNLLFNSGVAWRLVKGVASGTVTTNPQFVNYLANGTGDYRLKSTSPAINKGTATLAPTIDIAGVARPRGGAIDIGAYEF